MKTIKFSKSEWKIFTTIFMALLMSMVIVSCNEDDDDMPVVVNEPGNIVEVLEQITINPDGYPANSSQSASLKSQEPKFNHLYEALVKAGLATTVASSEITVFAPTDEAFEMVFDALGINGIDDLTAEQLTPILLYHVVGGQVMSSDLMDGYVETANGSAVKVDLSSGAMINDANVIIADLKTSNGLVHVIDKVILPPSMNLVESAISYDPEFSILVEAVVKAGLKETLESGGPFTIFAPTNDAFVDLLGELGAASLDDIPMETLIAVLQYHVIEGRVYSSNLMTGAVTTLNGKFNVDTSTLKITDANSREASLVPSLLDVQTTNGVIHVIDKVLLPPTMNLVEKALSFDPEFSILVQAVVKAGLKETLESGGPFTIFAPTNDAFVNLLDELGVASLDDIPMETLVAVLQYHVVEGKVYSSDLTTGAVTTLNGTFNVDTSTLKITDSNSRESNLIPSLLDVQATNGVIHVIDKVLLP